MRTLLTFLSVILISNTLWAQGIPNPSFENWTNQGSYDTPDNWETTNSPLLTNGVSKSTDAADQTYAARLETKFAAFISQNVPAAITNGTPDLANLDIVGGEPFTGRPASFGGSYKYFPAAAGDTGLISFVLTRYDAVNDSVILVGKAILEETDSVDTYTAFNIPVTYVDAGNPDTMLILISSSNKFDPPPPLGSVLYVDALEINWPVGIKQPLMLSKGYSIYPNPARDVLNIQRTGFDDHAEVAIFDILGNLVMTKSMDTPQMEIDITSLKSGIYLYRVSNQSGNAAQGKFEKL